MITFHTWKRGQEEKVEIIDITKNDLDESINKDQDIMEGTNQPIEENPIIELDIAKLMKDATTSEQVQTYPTHPNASGIVIS